MSIPIRTFVPRLIRRNFQTHLSSPGGSTGIRRISTEANCNCDEKFKKLEASITAMAKTEAAFLYSTSIAFMAMCSWYIAGFAVEKYNDNKKQCAKEKNER